MVPTSGRENLKLLTAESWAQMVSAHIREATCQPSQGPRCLKSRGPNMRPGFRLALFVSAYALVSTTLVVAHQRASAPLWHCEEEMHEYYIRRFESSDGFGLSRMPQPPMLDRSGVLQLGGKRYSVDRLELVGLQTASEPIVYVPLRHNLPFNRADFKSRPLSPFEKRALNLLRAGRTIELSPGEAPETIEVMGALRGDGTCLKCHKNVREGELLGAFSYRMRRER